MRPRTRQFLRPLSPYAFDRSTDFSFSKNRWIEEKKWPNNVLTMNMRIGINTGEMVTGNMGSKLHMN